MVCCARVFPAFRCAHTGYDIWGNGFINNVNGCGGAKFRMSVLRHTGYLVGDGDDVHADCGMSGIEKVCVYFI
jgi:hypothetical protein